jgi:hypothetical protein
VMILASRALLLIVQFGPGLGGHFKTGQWWTPQNRPTKTTAGQSFCTPPAITKSTNVSIHS